MASEIEEVVTAIRFDMMAIKYLVEALYHTRYRSLPQGLDSFRRFARNLKAQVEGPIPGADAILADHTNQGLLESLTAILDRIESRLSDPD